MDRKTYLKQSKDLSLLEAVVNTGIGFLISGLLCYFILPLWGIQKSIVSSAQITAIFTVASIARNYFIRRIFNKRLDNR